MAGQSDALLAAMRKSALAARPAAFRESHAWAAVAAVLALVVGVGGWMAKQSPSGPAVTRSADRIYASDANRLQVALPDGSEVLLDAHSRVAVNQTVHRRDVTLQSGQAFFKVAHDAGRPFVVAGGGRTVTATGTAFSVMTRGAQISVVLEQGKVRIDRPDQPSETVNLAPGQQYSASGTAKASVRAVDLDDALAWREGILSLHNMTVREALSLMDRARPPRVLLADAAVGALRVSGRFRADDPDAFVESLSAIYGVRIARLPSGQLKIRLAHPVGTRLRGLVNDTFCHRQKAIEGGKFRGSRGPGDRMGRERPFASKASNRTIRCL